MEQLLLRMSATLPQQKDRLVFLINNYDLILSIIDVSFAFVFFSENFLSLFLWKFQLELHIASLIRIKNNEWSSFFFLNFPKNRLGPEDFTASLSRDFHIWKSSNFLVSVENFTQLQDRVVQDNRIHSIIHELNQKAIGEFVEVRQFLAFF